MSEQKLGADCDRLFAECNSYKERAFRIEEQFMRWLTIHQDTFRAATQLAYQFKYQIDPNLLDEISDDIDCGSDCRFSTYDHTCNAHECSKNDDPHDKLGCRAFAASELRQFATSIRQQAWLLAFAPGAWNGLPPLIFNPAEAKDIIGLWVRGNATLMADHMQHGIIRWEKDKKASS